MWMEEALRNGLMAQQDQRISDAVRQDYPGLRAFIRKRVADQSDAEDILQEVFFELVEAYRLMKPVEQVTAWLFRVARNRITDLFRRRTREAQATEPAKFNEQGEELLLDELLPSPDAGPDAAYARGVLVEALDDALEELPAEQREVFIAHELMGYTFKELAEQSGTSVNTLLSRKHYAVLYLRKRLQSVYEEFTRR
jgi:RNA polymerase sigma factor (sigma-70 family)